MFGTSRLMLSVAVLICVCVVSPTEAVGGAKSRPKPQRKPKEKAKVEPVDKTPPGQNIDINQMTGTWYLLNTATKCSALLKHGYKIEPTVLILSLSGEKLSVITKTRQNHQCWEISQIYHPTSTSGRLTLKGPSPDLDTTIVIGATDYTSYAVMLYQRRGEITVKLFSRSVDKVEESMLIKFEELLGKQGLGLGHIASFPTYSHCVNVDEDHKINCVPTC
ncbi:complement component C8 gamma chain [Melanotaenia boesemani]|uniref:complement component C8 gamma chain n=1 Tax=Melanotaenia boesemani TaxID=1250792 RepID=UPI001C03FC96|nr:complement component C8 gamma chain [Melanotaenia boesemani]